MYNKPGEIKYIFQFILAIKISIIIKLILLDLSNFVHASGFFIKQFL